MPTQSERLPILEEIQARVKFSKVNKRRIRPFVISPIQHRYPHEQKRSFRWEWRTRDKGHRSLVIHSRQSRVPYRWNP